jgi:methionyl-tRNA formyltransferase
VSTVFLGTSDFAATVLERLADSPHRPALVVTPPDRPRGRGRRTQSPPAADAARSLGLELLQAANVNEDGPLERLGAAEPSAVLVCAFGQLIREPLLSAYEMLNVHPSLLPRWRGAAPIERAIMARDRETGVCVMRLVAELDAGPVALREAVPLGADEDFAALSARLAALGGELLVRALDLQVEGRLEFEEQSAEGLTYAEKIAPEERRLDPRHPAEELAATVRALTPHIGAYLETAGGERLGVRQADAVDAEVETATLRVEGDELLLGCGHGALRLEVVQPAGGRPMPVDAYLRGHPLPTL